MSITSTRTLVLSSNLDENKDKVSEKSHKIISLVSYLLAAPFLSLQTRVQTHLNDARTSSSRRHCSPDVHCAALLSSQVATACLHFSDCSTSSHESRSSRNELRSDPVSELSELRWLLSVQGPRV